MKPERAKTTMNTFPSSAEIVSEPLGVVLNISTWNYPFLLSLQPVIGAIAAGNAVVLKPSELAPATSELLSKLLSQYMDTSAVRVVEGAVPETTALLDQKWDKIFYTGNGKVGRLIAAAAAKHLTPLVLELGGKCPAIVDSNINLKVAVRRIISGKWGCNSGQTCVSPDYIITTKAFSAELVDALTSELKKFYGKDPLQSDDLSSIINSRHFDRLTSLLDDEKVSGKVVFGGQRDKSNLKIVPTILLDPPDDSVIMNDEIFGPLLPIITVDKVEDGIHGKINAKEKPLAAYLFTNDKKLQQEFIRNVSAGCMAINDTTLQLTEHSLPFGGVGESGFGAYHGKFSFEAFSHKKAVLIRSFAGDVEARYPPYSPGKLQFLKAVLSGNKNQSIIIMALDAEAVVKELRSTYTSGKTKSFEWRVSQLKALLKITTHHEKDIVEALRSDLNKPEYEAFVHEIVGISSECKFVLKELRKWMKPEKAKTTMTTFPSSAEIVSEPLDLSLTPVIGAIAAGNAVVLKPSEVAPATSSLLSKLLSQYMDTSAVKVIEGGVPETTILLDKKWDKILYTGNGKVGRVILAAAAKHLTPVVLELGGKSPAVVDSNINIKVAVRRIISGKWGSNSGQTCVSPDYIITTKAFSSQLVDALKDELEKFYGKDPMQSKDFSSIINSHHFDRITKLLDDEKVSGKIAPTTILDAPDDSLIMNEEIFGPLLPILTVDKIEDSIGRINAKEKPLAAYLFTNDKKLEEEFIRNVSAGSMAINDTVLQLAVNSLPFGGVGESGYGAYHGKFSFDAFSHKKAVLHRTFAGDIDARYPPYNPKKLQIIKALLSGNILSIIRALFGW
ncbi:hypothetical protein ACJIZ3_024616 [Penstemon smallii]|uniref:aldehyde dehydrogenase (NAD(+)) n=1 Tax=Penstemon smallii TaxID=265156 RepID=A0ABD3TUU9_9LAMI